MIQNNLNFEKNLILSNDAKNDLTYYDNSILSQAKTSSSSKDSKKNEEIITSEFQEIKKPLPIIYSFFPFENEMKNEKSKYNIFNEDLFNQVKLYPKENVNNFLGNKRYTNTNFELLLRKNKNEENKIKEIENENSLNKSAFKKIEISNEYDLNQSYFKSAFKTYFPYKKIKVTKQNKKKEIENKIIINETNTNPKVEKKRRLFKSINFTNVLSNNKDNMFEFKMTKKKRGRKPRNETKLKRVHDASDYDNILRKIQVHFLTFIICFANDLIEYFLPNKKELKFKNLSYNLKKTVNHSYVEKLKNKTIGEILQFDASSKNRKFSNTINKQIFTNVISLSPFLNNFFNMSYLELFNNYYLKCNRTVNLEGNTINYSPKTKLFTDLVQKNNDAADKIKQIAEQNYIEEANNIKQPIFVINKTNN